MGLGTIRYAVSPSGELLLSDSTAWLAARLGLVTLDVRSISEHLTYRYVSGTRTLFREISSVPAGYRVIFDEGYPARGGAALERALPFIWGRQDLMPLAEVCRSFEEELSRQTLRLSEGSGCLFFSGGLDSSLVASLYGERPAAITAGVDEEAYDECPRAERAAALLGLGWSGARVSEGSFLEILRRAVCLSGGTLPVEQIVSNQLLAESFSPSGPVLAGYGADFLFGEGQRKYWAVFRLGRITGMATLQMALGLYGLTGGRQRQQSLTARGFVRRLSEGDTWIDMMPALDPPCDPGIAVRSLGLESLPDFHEHRRRMLTDEMPPHLTQRVFVTYSNLISDTVSCWSRLMGSAGCELRLPFLSQPIVDLVCGLDPRSYLRVMSRKPVISAMASRRLPGAILGLPKMSGSLPVWRWIVSPAGGFGAVLDRLASRNFMDLGPSRDSLRASERYGYIPLWAAVNLELLIEHVEEHGARVRGLS